MTYILTHMWHSRIRVYIIILIMLFGCTDWIRRLRLTLTSSKHIDTLKIKLTVIILNILNNDII